MTFFQQYDSMINQFYQCLLPTKWQQPLRFTLRNHMDKRIKLLYFRLKKNNQNIKEIQNILGLIHFILKLTYYHDYRI